MAKHFRELRVYQMAFDAAMQLFELSKKWLKEERDSFSLNGHLSQKLTGRKNKIPGLLNSDGIGFWKIVPGIEGNQIGTVFLYSCDE